MPPIPLRNILQRLELPRRHTTRANIPHLPALNNIVQRPHNLLARRISIQSVDLEYIDVGT